MIDGLWSLQNAGCRSTTFSVSSDSRRCRGEYNHQQGFDAWLRSVDNWIAFSGQDHEQGTIASRISVARRIRRTAAGTIPYAKALVPSAAQATYGLSFAWVANSPGGPWKALNSSAIDAVPFNLIQHWIELNGPRAKLAQWLQDVYGRRMVGDVEMIRYGLPLTKAAAKRISRCDDFGAVVRLATQTGYPLSPEVSTVTAQTVS